MDVTMQRLFEKPLHANMYAQFRPEPPSTLINRVVQFVQEGGFPLDRALDVGCGSGQNTHHLAAHFNSVLATDISPAQINEAKARNTLQSVEYRESPAEDIPAPAGSVQLVTASECCHFFDLPRFFAEADRVLVPGGVLALYGYGMPEPYRHGRPWAEMDGAVKQALTSADETRQEVMDKYADPKFRIPYPGEIRDHGEHYQELPLSVDSLLGEMGTWGGFQLIVKHCGPQRGEALLQQARDRFLAVLSKSGDKVDAGATYGTTRFYYFLLMARKPVAS